MIIYQKGCKRVFVNFHESLRISGMGEDSIDMNTGEKMQQVYKKLNNGNADDRTKLLYSLTPRAGWRVFEFYGDICHGSAGTVIFGDADATRAKILAMMFDDTMKSS